MDSDPNAPPTAKKVGKGSNAECTLVVVGVEWGWVGGLDWIVRREDADEDESEEARGGLSRSLPSFLPSFLRSFLRSFVPSFLPSFLPPGRKGGLATSSSNRSNQHNNNTMTRTHARTHSLAHCVRYLPTYLRSSKSGGPAVVVGGFGASVRAVCGQCVEVGVVCVRRRVDV